MRFMGVIFDLDGTLVASESTYLRAWYQAAETVGRGMDDALYARLMGLNRADTIRQLGEIWAAPALAQRFVDESQRVYDSLVAGEGHLVRPGVLELLDHLASRGLPLAVATSSHRQLAKDTLVAADLAKYFQSLAAGDEVTQGKPAPDIYLLAAARLGVPPERCAAVEDSAAGAAAAIAAGMTVVLIPELEVEVSPSVRAAGRYADHHAAIGFFE
jgi:HAD superfamily hydrolase (TIGR01509 family)